MRQMAEIMAGATEMPRSCDINGLYWQRSPNTATVAKGLFGAVATPPCPTGKRMREASSRQSGGAIMACRIGRFGVTRGRYAFA